MRFARGDVRGPHRFTRDRPRSFVAALQSVTAEEKSKNQLSRDFWCCPIFDLCNSIGQTRKWRAIRRESALPRSQNDLSAISGSGSLLIASSRLLINLVEHARSNVAAVVIQVCSSF